MAKSADIPALTSLRFFAAAAVLLHHIAGFFPGYGGVSLFFVLSGFLLARKYGTLVTNGYGLTQFWKGRFKRIYPTHLACVALALPLGTPTLEALLANITLTQSWNADPATHFSLNAVAWSLSVEAFFYLCFPILAAANLKHACCALGALAFLAALLPDASHWAFYVNPLARLPEFVVGIALANAVIEWRPSGIHVLFGWAVTIGLVAVSPRIPLTEALIFVPASVATIVYASTVRSGWLTDPRLVMAGAASFTLYMIAHLIQRYVYALFGISYATALISGPIAIAAALAWHNHARLMPLIRLRHLPSP